MCRILLAALASFIIPAAMFSQIVAGPSDAFQIRYTANLNLGDSYIDITNAGTQGGTDTTGFICANVYAFDPNEELISCCTCLITPNALASLSVDSDIIAGVHTLTPAKPHSITVALLASMPVAGNCSPGAPGRLASGLRAWGTTLHRLPSGASALTETEFLPAALSAGELSHITSFCNFIGFYQPFGTCASCRAGGLSISK